MMDWEQKLAALNAISLFGATIKMRRPGNFYVSLSHVEIGNGHTLSSAGESGGSPELAVVATWDALTERLKDDEFIVLAATGTGRKHVRWNGFMWAELPTNS